MLQSVIWPNKFLSAEKNSSIKFFEFMQYDFNVGCE